MLVMLLYFILVTELAFVYTRVGAHLQVCIRMSDEGNLFLLALLVLRFAFRSALCCLVQTNVDFMDLTNSLITLL